MLISRWALAPVRTRVPAQTGARALRLIEPIDIQKAKLHNREPAATASRILLSPVDAVAVGSGLTEDDARPGNPATTLIFDHQCGC
jgi:hypothetical protein